MQPKLSRSLIANNISKVTILVVENDATPRLLMEVMLKRDNFNVMIAADSTEALDILRQQRVNGIIVGTLMSGISGMEFCRVLRARPDTVNLPILMLLSTSDAASIERSKAAGADDYLIKPVISRELTTKIRAMLHRD